MNLRALVALILVAALGRGVTAQSVRSRIRSSPRATTVSGDQAVDLTLTVAPAAVRPIQVWVRARGPSQTAGDRLTLYVPAADASAIRPDQRVRTFPVESRSSMYQARVSRVAPDVGRTRVEITLVAPPERGCHPLSGRDRDRLRQTSCQYPTRPSSRRASRPIVVHQEGEGQDQPQEIAIGLQGELYTQVLSGVKDGDEVVTFGSFFVDAEFKLKGGSSQP